MLFVTCPDTSIHKYGVHRGFMIKNVFLLWIGGYAGNPDTRFHGPNGLEYLFHFYEILPHLQAAGLFSGAKNNIYTEMIKRQVAAFIR
jgi:hypothetical protein